MYIRMYFTPLPADLWEVIAERRVSALFPDVIHIDAIGMEWDIRTHDQGNLRCLQGVYNTWAGSMRLLHALLPILINTHCTFCLRFVLLLPRQRTLWAAVDMKGWAHPTPRAGLVDHVSGSGSQHRVAVTALPGTLPWQVWRCVRQSVPHRRHTSHWPPSALPQRWACAGRQTGQRQMKCTHTVHMWLAWYLKYNTDIKVVRLAQPAVPARTTPLTSAYALYWILGSTHPLPIPTVHQRIR